MNVSHLPIDTSDGQFEIKQKEKRNFFNNNNS